MLVAVVANIILLAAILGFGRLIEPLFPIEFSRIDRLAVIQLGGMGLVGMLLFDVGIVRFSSAVVIGILALGIVALLISFWRKPARSGVSAALPRAAMPAAAVVACVLAVTAIGGLVKPTGDMQNDAIAYHFLGPKVWLRDSGIRPLPDQPCTAFPVTIESTYGALLAIGGPRAMEFFAVTGLLPLLLISAALALRLSRSVTAAWWAAALIAAMPAVYRGAYGGFIDAIYAAFVLCAARIGLDAKRLSDFALFGLFCGFAMGTKYTGLIAAVILFVVIALMLLVSTAETKWKLKALAVACALALAVSLPPYVRNWSVLGSPIYPPTPELLRFFPVKYMSRQAVEGFYHYIRVRGFGMGRSLSAFLLLPFHLTYYTAKFNGAGGIGLAPLAFAPLGVIAVRRDRFARVLAAVAVLLTVAWFLTEQESRFLIHVYALLGVFAAIGMFYAIHLEPRFGRALVALAVTVSIGYGLLMIGRARADDLRSAFSRSYADRRDAAEIPDLASFQYINEDEAVTKILILNPTVPAYYSNKDYVMARGQFGAEPIANPGALVSDPSRLARMHISDILDVRGRGGEFRVPDHTPDLTLVFERPNQRIYRVAYQDVDTKAGVAGDGPKQ